MESSRRPVNPMTRTDDEPMETSSEAFITLLSFSALMFTVPFAAFFAIKKSLLAYFNINEFTNNCWSSLGAVIAVNLIMCIYIARAFREDSVENKKNK